ncbi:MAG: hypothetical protein HY508_11995 [Acidobacteria bacterium]|nr:hypothetical protein [Acidobacteriota bacterium]
MKGAEASVAAKLKDKYAPQFPPGMYDSSVGPNIQKAYRVVSGSTE